MPADAVFRFNRAIVRSPPASCVSGLRAVDTGPPDFPLFVRQYGRYVAALRRAGVTVTELPPLEAFPDSAFVEDTALCLPQGAVLLRPGAPSRRGESAAMATELARWYDQVGSVTDGRIDGGDVLVTDDEIIVGLSARTDVRGAEALSRHVKPWGYTVRSAATPAGVLHLKSDCAPLGDNRVLCTTRLAASGVFAGYQVLEVAKGEEPAANAVRINDTVLVAAGYGRTAALLDDAGYRLQIIDLSEAARLDAGLSCLSLRFARPDPRTPPGDRLR